MEYTNVNNIELTLNNILDSTPLESFLLHSF